MSGARVSLALPSRATLEAVALCVEDLEEERGGAIELKVDREGAFRMADPCNLALAAGHEDLAGGDRFDLYSGRRSVTVGVLQLELERPPRWHHVGEEPREADPRAWGHQRP